jgi:hypothetical protein
LFAINDDYGRIGGKSMPIFVAFGSKRHASGPFVGTQQGPASTITAGAAKLTDWQT